MGPDNVYLNPFELEVQIYCWAFINKREDIDAHTEEITQILFSCRGSSVSRSALSGFSTYLTTAKITINIARETINIFSRLNEDNKCYPVS